MIPFTLILVCPAVVRKCQPICSTIKLQPSLLAQGFRWCCRFLIVQTASWWYAAACTVAQWSAEWLESRCRGTVSLVTRSTSPAEWSPLENVCGVFFSSYTHVCVDDAVTLTVEPIGRETTTCITSSLESTSWLFSSASTSSLSSRFVTFSWSRQLTSFSIAIFSFHHPGTLSFRTDFTDYLTVHWLSVLKGFTFVSVFPFPVFKIVFLFSYF